MMATAPQVLTCRKLQKAVIMLTFSYARVLQTFNRPICTFRFYNYTVIRRGISSSSSVRDEDTSGEDSAFKRNTRAKVDPQTVEDWFQGEGLPYLNPTPSKPNWLGGRYYNPTFRPPPPLSDVVKSSIYDRYKSSVLSDPQSHVRTIRALSERFGISIGRVEAIIRLKQYEHQYQKGKKIQHAFQRGMESYLGVRQDRDRATVSQEKFTPTDINFTRQRTAEVDREASESGERTQKAGAARRVWWEMVDDVPDAQPVVSNLVAEGLKEYRTKLTEDQQAHAGVALRVEGRPSPQGKPRSVFAFIDTGAKGLSSPKKTLT